MLAAAQVAGHIDQDKPNPARWANWLELQLPNPRKIGPARGHHAALPYAEVPELMAQLAAIDSTASRALQLTILCARRTARRSGRDGTRYRSTTRSGGFLTR